MEDIVNFGGENSSQTEAIENKNQSPFLELKKKESEENMLGQTMIKNDENDMMSSQEVLNAEMTSIAQDASGVNVGDNAQAESINALTEIGEEFGLVRYLENERNLTIPTIGKDSIDVDTPFSSLRMAGQWLREAGNLHNYWQGIENLGAEVASYKWAYDEGKMGEFDRKKFTKEAMKAGARTIGSDSLRMMGNMMTMFGANLEESSIPTTVMTAGAGMMIPQAGGLFKKLGNSLKEYADNVGNSTLLAPSASLYDEDPSWERLANVVGSGSAQVLTMGALSKFIGSGATYGLFATGGAGEIFSESLEQDGDIEKANALALANAGVTFGIDKIFNPLPKMVEKNAKLTSQKIASEMLGAPLREAGTEVLQQMLAENLVRKVGLDDTQDLFEGLIESALGAMAGSTALVSATGGSYFAHRTYEDARRRILLKGVTNEEFELYKNNMLQMIESKPEAFEKILSYNLDENLKIMDREARKMKNKVEGRDMVETLKQFATVKEEMYKRFLPALGDEAKARAAATFFESNAIGLYQYNRSMTPEKLLNGMLPAVEKTNYASFLASAIPETSVLYSFGGSHAKNANIASLAVAKDLAKKKLDAQAIWQKTGWHKGGDNKWRMEISDKNARIRYWTNSELEDSANKYRRGTIDTLERSRAYIAAALRATADEKYSDYYQAFVKYLNENPPETPWYEDDLYDPFMSTIFSYQIIDDESASQRWVADARLNEIIKRYQESVGKKNVEKTLEDLLTGQQNKQSDFTEEEYKFLKAGKELAAFESFWKRYPNVDVGRNAEYDELARRAVEENLKNRPFFERLVDIEDRYQQAKESRKEALEKIGHIPYNNMFYDLERDRIYDKYRLFMGDYSDRYQGEEYYPQWYKEAYKPVTKSELFLQQDQYKFLSEIERKKLEGHLDAVEQLYQFSRHIDYLKAYDKRRNYVTNQQAKNRYLDGIDNPKERERWQYRFLLKNGFELSMVNLLDHEELYKNYPEIKDMKVRFGKLKDDMPYHYYHDAEKGYVLELDAEQLDYANMKEVLLKGAGFAIQDIEGFDYSLSDEERQNFMDRQVYLAKKEVEADSLAEFDEFMDRHFPEIDRKFFVNERNMPVSLIGLGESAMVDNITVDVGGKKPETIKFKEVDYDKLTRLVATKYGTFDGGDNQYIRDVIYWELQEMRNQNSSKISAIARANGGYMAPMMPWSGLTAQGAVDARALLSRMAGDVESVTHPFFESTSDLRVRKADMARQIDETPRYLPEAGDFYEEFQERYNRDMKNTKETVGKLAHASFDKANNVMRLFEQATPKDVVHETLHFFNQLLKEGPVKYDSNKSDFNLTMDTLRENFISMSRIQYTDGKFFAMDKKTGEHFEELPLGYDSEQALVEAGAEELLVGYIMAMYEGRIDPMIQSDIAEAVDFYRKWLYTMTTNLEITPEKTNPKTKKFLKFLKNKIK